MQTKGVAADLLVVDVEVDVEEVPEPEEDAELQRLGERRSAFLPGLLARRRLPGGRGGH